LLAAYKKEECENDPGWCFTAAVGKSLPKTFFAYGKTTSESARKAAKTKGFAKDSANVVLPTISTELKDYVPNVESGTQTRLGSRSTFNLRHRFEAIHYQRGVQSITGSDQDSDAIKQSNKRGYTDGVNTAKIFASYGPGMSRLGFTGQYILDAIAVAGPSLIMEGTEDGYRSGFMKGLEDGESQAGAS